MEKNLNQLYHDLATERYIHGSYRHFVVQDTKRRDVYVATVRDRVVHQMVSEHLDYLYGRHFYRYSCAAQKDKGTSFARVCVLKIIKRLKNRRPVWVGKLDVKHYFRHIRHDILLALLKRKIADEKIIGLCEKIISSFGVFGLGLPLGNFTSQWLANIYLHEIDWWIKHTLKVRYYIRYNDDLLVTGTEKDQVGNWIKAIQRYADKQLSLQIPDNKTEVVGLPRPVDILGLRTNGDRVWLRSKTVRKAKRKLLIKEINLAPEFLDTVCSYRGMKIF